MLGARGAGGERQNVEGMDHDSSDVLAAEPRRKGGLIRSDNVSPSYLLVR
jgi:pre-mRNA-splicing factor ATP-dependent RNA helicase DHX38/PRP16